MIELEGMRHLARCLLPLAVYQRGAAAVDCQIHVYQIAVQGQCHRGLSLVCMPHVVGQNVLVVAQEVVPGGSYGEVTLHAQLMNSRNEGAVLTVCNQQDELVVAYVGSASDDVMDQSHVGLIVECDGSRHAHVHVGMAAVHRAGQDGGTGALSHLLGQTDGVEAVHAVGAVGTVLLDGTQRQNSHVAHFLGVCDIHGCGVVLKMDRVSLVQFKAGLLHLLVHGSFPFFS